MKLWYSIKNEIYKWIHQLSKNQFCFAVFRDSKAASLLKAGAGAPWSGAGSIGTEGGGAAAVVVGSGLGVEWVAVLRVVTRSSHSANTALLPTCSSI